MAWPRCWLGPRELPQGSPRKLLPQQRFRGPSSLRPPDAPDANIRKCWHQASQSNRKLFTFDHPTGHTVQAATLTFSPISSSSSFHLMAVNEQESEPFIYPRRPHFPYGMAQTCEDVSLKIDQFIDSLFLSFEADNLSVSSTCHYLHSQL